jgi:predicted nuclease of predicted toxin-antitoxin system
MKFLVDAQLPKLLSDYIASKGHNCVHTLSLPNKNHSTDKELLTMVVEENRILITKDLDFLNSFLIKKTPPKLILVRTGNIRNNELLAIFRKHLDRLINTINENDLIEINQSEIVVHV